MTFAQRLAGAGRLMKKILHHLIYQVLEILDGAKCLPTMWCYVGVTLNSCMIRFRSKGETTRHSNIQELHGFGVYGLGVLGFRAPPETDMEPRLEWTVVFMWPHFRFSFFGEHRPYAVKPYIARHVLRI